MAGKPQLPLIDSPVNARAAAMFQPHQ
jgi:hypothetical protein